GRLIDGHDFAVLFFAVRRILAEGLRAEIPGGCALERVFYGEARNTGVQREIEFPAGRRAGGGHVRLSQIQAARPVHDIGETLVCEWKALQNGLGCFRVRAGRSRRFWRRCNTDWGGLGKCEVNGQAGPEQDGKPEGDFLHRFPCGRKRAPTGDSIAERAPVLPFSLSATTSRYTSSVARALLRQLKCVARCKPRVSIRLRRSSSSRTSAMARAILAGLRGSNSSPAPSATSGMADVFEHATAQPQAMASRIGRPKPS